MQFNIVSCMTMVIIFLMCANPGNGGKVKLPGKLIAFNLLIAINLF